MANFTCHHWVLLATLIVVVVGVAGYLIYLYLLAGVIWVYAGILLVIALFFTIPTCVLSKTHDLHVHHTNIGMVIITILGYQNPLVTILHGIGNGVMIEGGCKWGYDAIWENKDGDDRYCECASSENDSMDEVRQKYFVDDETT